MSNPIDDYELARDEYLSEKEKEYSFEKNGRFAKTLDGKIVEIISYTKAESSNEEQELFYRDSEDSLVYGYLSDFEDFAIHDSILMDNPIKFGDMVELKDIPTSTFLTLEQTMQETYDLFFNKVGLVTQVLEETQIVLVAFIRDVVEIPIHLLKKLYVREIW